MTFCMLSSNVARSQSTKIMYVRILRMLSSKCARTCFHSLVRSASCAFRRCRWRAAASCTLWRCGRTAIGQPTCCRFTRTPILIWSVQKRFQTISIWSHKKQRFRSCRAISMFYQSTTPTMIHQRANRYPPTHNHDPQQTQPLSTNPQP